MTVAATNRKAGPYNGNGATTSFPFGFKVFAASEVVVTQTDLTDVESTLTLTTHYTVTLNADQDANPGGTVDMLVAPATGYLLTLTSGVPLSQSVTLTNGGGFYPGVISAALDRVTIFAQQLAEQLERAVKVGVSSATAPDQLIGQLNVNVAAAQASATAADASADAADISEANAAGSAANALTSENNAAASAADAAAAVAAAIGVTVQGYDADIATVSASQVEMEAGTEVALRTMSPLRVAQAVAALAVSGMPRSYLAGLVLSNNVSDATNDIDIAAGACRDSTNAANIVLASALTKRLDANWAVGTNQGGLDTGSIANATYHVFAIKRSDTGVVDVLFSTSASAPTMPANYDYKRRIGSIVRTGGAIKPFVQDGDLFQWLDGVLDADVTAPGASAVTRTLTLPTGVNVQARLNVYCKDGNNSTATYFSDLSVTDAAPSGTAAPLATAGSLATSIAMEVFTHIDVRTNTSAQIRTRTTVGGGTAFIRIATMGWLDSRGRNA